MNGKTFYRSIKVLFFCFLPVLVNGQDDLLNRLTQKAVECRDVSLNSSELFSQFIETGQYDSARMVLGYWEMYCERREPLVRARIILQILDGKLSENDYDTTVLDRVDNYLSRLEFSEKDYANEYYDYYAPTFGFVPFNSRLDKTTKQIFSQIEVFDNDLEVLFSLLYSGKVDEFYKKLQEPVFAGTIIQRQYNKQVVDLLKLASMHYGFGLGAISPGSGTKHLGAHPFFNMVYGMKYRKFTYDMAFDLRFGRTREPFRLVTTDTFKSDNYTNVFAGINVSYDLIYRGGNGLLLTAGTGIEMMSFDTLTTDQNEGESFYSPNLNLGMMLKIKTGKQGYLGLTYKYHLIHYDSPRLATDLSGGFHALSLNIGFLGNDYRQSGLKKLRYQESHSPYLKSL